MMCVGQKGKDADLLILIREEVHRLLQGEKNLTVKHGKAHLSKNAHQEQSLFKRFITEGNAKGNERAKVGALMGGDEMA